ncbi:hypothetical protein Poly59_56070 [Rubripirellula reticaptiva]|uniref:Uncharacterized protein n=1 Tax=Rubripirellula reticaptiva TaxID=2528013 RepID=A0A5C6EDW9_9BACT|nr:hypothetical protein Poly59_56070 [Rubripirellula reticaptiva]
MIRNRGFYRWVFVEYYPECSRLFAACCVGPILWLPITRWLAKPTVVSLRTSPAGFPSRLILVRFEATGAIADRVLIRSSMVAFQLSSQLWARPECLRHVTRVSIRKRSANTGRQQVPYVNCRLPIFRRSQSSHVGRMRSTQSSFEFSFRLNSLNRTHAIPLACHMLMGFG